MLNARVGHQRFSPKQHSFVYRVFYLARTITDQETESTPWLFSRNQWNLMSVYDVDHGPKDGSSLRVWITQQCQSQGITLDPEDRVELVAHPRVLGYVFNPISYWVIYHRDEYVQAVLCEVHNTFGDDHNYFLTHADHRAIVADDMFEAEKHLYVSPYNRMKGGRYQFSFDNHPEGFKSVINYFEDQTHLLNTYMGGTYRPITNRVIIFSLLRHPLMTVMVVVRIHLQALRLWIKKVPLTLRGRPGPTTGGTTRGRS